jgi:hypothetical protein
MVDSPNDGKPRADSEEEPGHRFVFGRRWEARKHSRSTKNAWMVLALDVVLLLIISGMAWTLIERLK